MTCDPATTPAPAEFFAGHEQRECGEHRTVGPVRAWCFDCTEWCYPGEGCKGCRLGAIANAPAEGICGVVCTCGPNLEPLACGWPHGHVGAHAWSTLPTFTATGGTPAPAGTPWYEDPAHMYSPPGEPDPGCPPAERDPLPCPACGGDVYLHLGGHRNGQLRCKDCDERLVVVAGGGGTENGDQ